MKFSKKMSATSLLPVVAAATGAFAAPTFASFDLESVVYLMNRSTGITDIGHTWLQIENVNTSAAFGFWPGSPAAMFLPDTHPGKVNSEPLGGDFNPYDSRWCYPISDLQLYQLTGLIYDDFLSPADYDLTSSMLNPFTDGHNCTSWATGKLREIGLVTPAETGFLGHSCPARLDLQAWFGASPGGSTLEEPESAPVPGGSYPDYGATDVAPSVEAVGIFRLALTDTANLQAFVGGGVVNQIYGADVTSDTDDVYAVVVNAPAQPGIFLTAVDWGDGTTVRVGRQAQPFESNDKALYSHTYKNPGAYTVKIVVIVNGGVEIIENDVVVAAGDGHVSVHRSIHSPSAFPAFPVAPYLHPPFGPNPQDIFQ